MNLELDASLSDEDGTAFSADFRQHLQDGDVGVNWAARLSEFQLYLLLWYVGECACRIPTRQDDEKYHSLISIFGVPTATEKMMTDAFKTIVKVYKESED